MVAALASRSRLARAETTLRIATQAMLPDLRSFPAAESLKQTRFGVNHPSVMSDNKPPVDPLHIASPAPVQEPKKKGPNESKTTNRLKDQAKLSRTMKTQSEPSRRD
jgi:hypothetical protein